MKKIFLILLSLSTCILLSAYSSEEALSKEMTNKANQKQSANKFNEEEINDIIISKIEQLEKEMNDENFITEYSLLRFYQSEIPQILTISEVNRRNTVNVHMYDEDNRKWNVIFEDSIYGNNKGSDSLHILERVALNKEADLQYAIIGLVTGSYLSFYILGQNKGEIGIVLDRMSLDAEAGEITIDDQTVVVKSKGKVIEKINLIEALTNNK